MWVLLFWDLTKLRGRVWKKRGCWEKVKKKIRGKKHFLKFFGCLLYVYIYVFFVENLACYRINYGIWAQSSCKHYGACLKLRTSGGPVLLTFIGHPYGDCEFWEWRFYSSFFSFLCWQTATSYQGWAKKKIKIKKPNNQTKNQLLLWF